MYVALAAVMMLVAVGLSSSVGNAAGTRTKSLSDLKPIVFDAEMIMYGEYNAQEIMVYASVANIGTARATAKPKPIVRLNWDAYPEGQMRWSSSGDYELGPIPQGGVVTVQSYHRNNLTPSWEKYYISAVADPGATITELDESNNVLGGYFTMSCTNTTPDPVYGYDCCLTFEGSAWKRSGTVCY